MRKNAGTLTVAISMLIVFFATVSFTQAAVGEGSGGWGMGTADGKMYNPKTVEAISGEVISVDKIAPVMGMSSYGGHIMVKTDKEILSVHLGPGWFIENQDITIEPKDNVEVKGSLITFEGKPAIIAVEIKKEDDLLILRDENGFPAWSGWRMR